MLGVWRHLFNFGLPNITSEGIIEVTDASVNIIRGSLDDHFDSAVQDIADEAGQAVTTGDIVSGKAEADALDSANKGYVFCALSHLFTLRISHCLAKCQALAIHNNARLFVPQAQGGAINKVHQ